MKTRFKFYSKSLFVAASLLLPGSARADSLWSAEYSIGLMADKKARAIGDIVTVVVQESATTSKDSSTQTAKKTALDASISSFLYTPAASSFLTKNKVLPKMGMTSANSFDGSGKINNSESIVARFGVRVVDVLPNKNLIVEGLRQTSFAGESRIAMLRGIVRPQDITPDNSVLSYNLADVSIKFEDSGALNSANRKGWFSRVWDVLTPF